MSPFMVGLVITSVFLFFAHDYYLVRNNPALVKKDFVARTTKWIHEKTIDFRLKDRGQRVGSPQVAILAIDERSIESEGRWPWSRKKIAELVEKTLDGGAKSISFDMIFSERDANSSVPTLLRMRKDLRHQSELSANINQTIEHELGLADSDHFFAETIKKQADSLIMGSYFESFDPSLDIPPTMELCLDSLFERSYENHYWGKEKIPLLVIDEPFNKLPFPREIRDNLDAYLSQLETRSSSQWFANHPEKYEDISKALSDLDIDIPKESYPGVVPLWLNDNQETLLSLLEMVSPNLANEEGVRIFIRQLQTAFTQKEIASLQAELRQSGLNYCAKFFTDRDELQSLTKFQKEWDGWGEKSDLEETFHTMSWEKIFSSLKPLFKEFVYSTPNNDSENLNDSEFFQKAIQAIQKLAYKNGIESVYRWWINIPELGNATKHSGFFNAHQDSDGSIRRSFLFVRRGNSYVPSLEFKTFLVEKGYSTKIQIGLDDTSTIHGNTKIVKKMEILSSNGEHVMDVPVDPMGRLTINYAGGKHMFPYVSAADILSNAKILTIETQKQNEFGQWEPVIEKVERHEFLKNKLLFLGATATGIYDLRVTPYEENYPGVETHANVLSNLLVESEKHELAKNDPQSLENSNFLGFMKTHPQEEISMWLILLGVGVTISALLSYLGPISGLAVTGLSIGAVYAVDKYVFFSSGVITTIVFPIGLLFSTFVTMNFYKYFTEERKKRELKGTFEKYVSPAIVAEVLSDPENIELGGKKMELTVLFSDVRGFTTISEKLDPRALSDLLNSYLTPMTNLVFENKGTLDKYMGDAIMAFWGAPIHFADHAKHACRCALQMIDKLKELQREYQAQGLPEIDIGIGLNTGEMSVGNMGSDTVRSYTVMGDAVNLGSRLEGINKQYGTRIIISEFTYDAVKESFATREVDWVRVKGKAQPVRIFELICEGQPEEAKTAVIQKFTEGFSLYHRREFQNAIDQFNEAIKIDPDDAVTQLYLERCEDYLKEPPPENWDGVFTMTSK